MKVTNPAIVVQMFLVHALTRELQWYGQVAVPRYFKHKGAAETAATKAAEQIPAALIAT